MKILSAVVDFAVCAVVPLDSTSAQAGLRTSGTSNIIATRPQQQQQRLPYHAMPNHSDSHSL